MIVVKSSCTEEIKQDKTVYVELWDEMSMRPHCHTDLVQKYDLGWKLIPIYNNEGQKANL